MMSRIFKCLCVVMILAGLAACTEQAKTAQEVAKPTQSLPSPKTINGFCDADCRAIVDKTYTSRSGVSVRGISIPDNKLKKIKRDELIFEPYIHQLYKDGDDWVVVLIYVSSSGSSLYMTEPTATLDGRKLMLGGVLKRDENEAVCCPGVYPFEFRIPNMTEQTIDKKLINWDGVHHE